MTRYTNIIYVDDNPIFLSKYKRKSIAIREAFRITSRSKISSVHVVGTDGTFMVIKNKQIIFNLTPK